jgi:hypothetical protein
MPQCSHSSHRDAVKAGPTGFFQRTGVKDGLIQVRAKNAFWSLRNRNRLSLRMSPQCLQAARKGQTRELHLVGNSEHRDRNFTGGIEEL